MCKLPFPTTSSTTAYKLESAPELSSIEAHTTAKEAEPRPGSMQAVLKQARAARKQSRALVVLSQQLVDRSTQLKRDAIEVENRMEAQKKKMDELYDDAMKEADDWEKLQQAAGATLAMVAVVAAKYRRTPDSGQRRTHGPRQ